ncbi:MAG: diguanylate cyclase [Propionivibrio sp.]
MNAPRARLLIVDDETINLRMLDGMLRDDYDISVALGGEQALRRAFATPPDLILLDIQMDGMDGYEVCRRLKENELTRDIPVIFVTSKSDIVEEIKGLELGAVDYITKPFHPLIIRIRLKNHLELKRQRDILNRLSSLDGLTGIANRRYFDTFLATEWSRTVRSNEEIALVMIDVDHFKSYNDHYGHIAGDDCLKAISAALSGALTRSTDLAARYGGEEFACILTSTGLPGALKVAGKLRAATLALAIPHAFSPTHSTVTLSFGVATARPGHSDMQTADLLLAADRQLYLAKAAGRNRIESTEYTPNPAAPATESSGNT